MKHLNPELEKLEKRIAPDIGIGIGIGITIGIDGTTRSGCTSTGDATHSTGRDHTT
jgi:hypothetical protein